MSHQPVVTTTVDEYYAEVLKRVLKETEVYDILFQNVPKYFLSKDRVMRFAQHYLTEEYQTVILHRGPMPSLDALEQVLQAIGVRASRGGGESKNSIFVKASHPTHAGTFYHLQLKADFT